MANTPTHMTIQVNGGNTAKFITNVSTATIAMHRMNNVVNATNKSMLKLMPYTPPDYCNVRRGGPRSKIRCEIPKHVPHEFHTGRGQTGSWFSWKDRELE